MFSLVVIFFAPKKATRASARKLSLCLSKLISVRDVTPAKQAPPRAAPAFGMTIQSPANHTFHHRARPSPRPHIAIGIDGEFDDRIVAYFAALADAVEAAVAG